MPSTPTHPLVAFACNNAWANVRLYRACSQLDQAELVAPRTSFFPSIAKTLNHLLTVDWFYVDALERAVAGREPNPQPYAFFDPEFPYDTAADLAREQRLVDDKLALKLGDAREFRDVSPASFDRLARRVGVDALSAAWLAVRGSTPSDQSARVEAHLGHMRL